MNKMLKKSLGILCAATMSATILSFLTVTANAEVYENIAITQTTNNDGFVNTFIGEKFYDDKITDIESAYKCLDEVIERLGGDESTKLELDYIQPNENGMTVMSFSQRAEEMLVYGSTVKLILNENDEPVGLVSSLSPDVESKPLEEWAVTENEAEKIVMDKLADEGSEDTIVEGATKSVIINVPNVTEADYRKFICAWAVFTYNKDVEMNDYAYTAHYVGASGEYLYDLPVSGPDDDNADSGQSAAALFDFDAYEKGETTVKIVNVDGSAEEVTVPTLTDPKTGKSYLADGERKILCADFGDFGFNDILTPTEAVNVHPYDAHAYYNFIRVWDMYAQMGWTGPDGEGTPSLLLMNFIDNTGGSSDNAMYMIKDKGFQIFIWTRLKNYGGCLDVVGHEFTHCVTTKAMKYMLYKNDTGAINEGYSDIMGSLIEIQLDGRGDGSWTMGENLGAILRNMADPHECSQPEFVFDTYYAPFVSVPTEINDDGGVHANSSLLSLIAVKLDEAGMTPEDQFYFWLNSALVISPQTDYPMMAEILPWVMDQLGYDQYLDALNDAIKEAKFTTSELPEEIPEGCGVATFDFYDFAELAENGRVCILYYKSSEINSANCVHTWPVSGTTTAQTVLPVGEYYIIAGIADPDGYSFKKAILTEDGWKFVGYNSDEFIMTNGMTISVKNGEITVVPYANFKKAGEELLKLLDLEYAENDAETEQGDVQSADEIQGTDDISGTEETNPPTSISLAGVPVMIITGLAAVISRKRKIK